MWVVWLDPLFSVFSVSAPFPEAVEIVHSFVYVVFGLVGLIQQVQLLD